jgi:hypothetical protein
MSLANEGNLLFGLGWLARILGAISIALLLLFIIGEPTGFSSITWDQAIAFVFFPCGLIVGLVLAWYRELLGGLIAVGSVVGFYVIYEGLLYGGWPGWWFMVFGAAGILHLLHATFSPPNKPQERNLQNE